jgi:hypothetical protein
MPVDDLPETTGAWVSTNPGAMHFPDDFLDDCPDDCPRFGGFEPGDVTVDDRCFGSVLCRPFDRGAS